MSRKNGVLGGAAIAGSGCLALVMIVGIVLATRYGSHTPEAEYVRHNTEGNRFYSQGGYKGAVREYSEMIRLKPLRSQGYFFRAMANDKLGAWDKAIEDETKVLNMTSVAGVQADEYYNRGLSYLGKGDMKRAHADFASALEMNPGNLDALKNRADSARRMGDFKSCIADINRVMKHESPTFSDHFIRGMAYIGMNKPDLALDDLSIASGMQTSNPYAWGELAWVHYMKGDLSKAATEGAHAIQLDPRSDTLHFNLGLYYAAQNQKDLADEQYLAGIQHTNSADIGYALAEIKKARSTYSGSGAILNHEASTLSGAYSRLTASGSTSIPRAAH